MTTVEFFERFAEFLGRNGRPPTVTPWDLVERWEALTEAALRGYHSGFYEFSNDLSVRDLLEKAFNDPQLEGHEITRLMRERVTAADDQMRQAFQPGTHITSSALPWWHRGVLARGGKEYAEDIARLYGIDVETVT